MDFNQLGAQGAEIMKTHYFFSQYKLMCFMFDAQPGLEMNWKANRDDNTMAFMKGFEAAGGVYDIMVPGINSGDLKTVAIIEEIAIEIETTETEDTSANRAAWTALGTEYALDFEDSEVAFEAAKGDNWDKWARLDFDQQMDAAVDFGIAFGEEIDRQEKMKTLTELEKVITVQEAATLFDKKEDTIRHDCQRGNVTARKSGATWLILRDEAQKRWGK